MTVCFLVLTHLPGETRILLELLSSFECKIVVHVDSKCKIEEFTKEYASNNIHYIENRSNVKWGTFSQVDASLKLMKYARSVFPFCFRYALVSGDSVPVVSPDAFARIMADNEVQFLDIREISIDPARMNWDRSLFVKADMHYRAWRYFNGPLRYDSQQSSRKVLSDSDRESLYNLRKEIYRKFFFAPQWWCLTGELVDFVISEMQSSTKREFFTNLDIPDEHFVATIIGNSEHYNAHSFKKFMMNHWKNKHQKQGSLTIEQINGANKRGFIFARKTRVNSSEPAYEAVRSLIELGREPIKRGR